MDLVNEEAKRVAKGSSVTAAKASWKRQGSRVKPFAWNEVCGVRFTSWHYYNYVGVRELKKSLALPLC